MLRKRFRDPVEPATTLVGREVSCGVFASVFRAVEREGLNPLSLVAGTGFSVEHFQDPTERVSWQALQLLADRLAHVWTDEQLRAIGCDSLKTQHFEPQIFLARLLLRPTDAYAFVIRGDSQGDFACLSATTTVEGQQVTIDIDIADGYGHSPAFFNILAGAAEGLPTLFGLEPAVVEMSIHNRGARFDIVVPPGGGRWSLTDRLRHRVARPRLVEQVDDRLGLRTDALETEVAKRLTMEVELKAALDEHNRRLANLNDVVIETGADGEVLFVSPSLETVLKVGREEFLADPWSILQPPAGGMTQPWISWVEATSRWIEVNPSSYSDDSSALLLVVRDVTDRIDLEAEVGSRRRLESLGVMAAGVAHDFNNLLVPIRANAGSLASDIPLASPLRDRARAIERAAEMATSLVDQILASTGHSARPNEVCDLAAAVRDMQPVLEVLLSTGVSLEVNTQGPAVARIDRESVDQLVTNLVLNADQAIPGEGTVTVSVIAGPDGPSLRVADDGVGMTPELAERMTEPFFTTKPDGRGLGLAHLAGLIRSETVQFGVASAVGKGTTLTVRFSGADDVDSDQRSQPDQAAWVSKDTRLLLVDDDELVRDTMDLVLRPHLASVVCVESADQAMALVESDAEIDVVVSDLTMPQMRGPSLIRHIRSVRPDLPCLLVTGAGTEAARSELEEAGVARVGIVAKPFTPPQMLDAIAEEMGRAVRA